MDFRAIQTIDEHAANQISIWSNYLVGNGEFILGCLNNMFDHIFFEFCLPV